MNKREQIVAEMRRVSSLLGTKHLTKKGFVSNSKISSSTVLNIFGSWNRAVEAAGLKPRNDFVPEHKEIPEEELMAEIIRLTKQLQKRPSEREMQALGKLSPMPYRKRWGTFVKGREVAYQKLGFPELDENDAGFSSEQAGDLPKPAIVPETIKPKKSQRRRKVQFGEPIDFRGLRFAPINEQGVVYLFGMISRELGFLIESIRTEYPDCEGKRCVSEKENRWEHVLIEFEYKSSNFKQHGHSTEGCDLIVCWIHDWAECPMEVLELRSTTKHLHN
jgi:hypothetical protein